jgi:two-component system LytT family sensor kinase
MIRIKKRDWIEIVIHLAFWTAVFYTISSLSTSTVKWSVKVQNGKSMVGEMKETLSSYYLTVVFLMILFYGNIFWIFRKVLQFKKIFSRLAVGLGWFAFIFFTNYMIAGAFTLHQPVNLPLPLPAAENFASAFGSRGWLHMQLTMLLVFGSVLGLSVAYFFLKEWARNELIRSQLAASQYSTEIKFLKSQINPHFLFNTLNNLFSMAQKKGNDDLADGISRLSGMMRYMIYESNEETVPLKKEIEYLENCILLNKLRYADNEAKVTFKYPEQCEDIFIAPMLFIPFVENAFKHGVVIGQTSTIDISVSVSNKDLIFSCQNTIYRIRKMEDEKSGIGLENVLRRLQLVYPDKYELNLRDNDAKYSVELKIILS